METQDEKEATPKDAIRHYLGMALAEINKQKAASGQSDQGRYLAIAATDARKLIAFVSVYVD